ncbi:MAG: class I SAM-dependent methyltransferase [Patescibacteria group bacterium]
MDILEIKKLSELEDSYWWFVGRRAVVASVLERFLGKPGQKFDILDFGSGTGGNFALLSRWGKVQGVEVSELAIELSCIKHQDMFVKHLKPKDPALPFAESSFDLIVLLDVLEHIEDDLQILSDLNSLLKEQGRLLLTVPAHPWLWSSHDRVLGHFRRYTTSDIRNKLELAGFEINYLTYFMFSISSLLIAHRFGLKVLGSRHGKQQVSYPPVPKWLNHILVLLLKTEALLLCWGKLPFGTSILVLVTKK